MRNKKLESEVIEEGISIDFNDVQFSKILISLKFTELGISTSVNDVQSLKRDKLSLVNDDGLSKDTFFNDAHLLKHNSLIELTEEGMHISFNEVHCSKQFSPIVFKEDGFSKIICSREVH